MTLFDGAPIMTVGWNAALGAWLAVYSDLLVNEVVACSAPELTGPWSEAVRLFESVRPDDGSWTYDAVRHPELDADGGRTIFVSHSRPKGTGWFDAELPLWRVELAAE